MKSVLSTSLSIEEKIVSLGIRWIWLWYFTGLLFLVGSAIAWILFIFLIWRFSQDQHLKVHWLTIVWCIATLALLLITVIGHINHDLSTAVLFKSMIGWAKGWALFGLLMLCASLPIRPQIITQALLCLGKQTVLISPLLLIAALLHLPSSLYSSPLKFLANPAFFEIELYGLNASTGLPRWRLFTPWGPALGLYGNMLFAFCCQANKQPLRNWGFFAAVLMVLLSQSRMGMFCLVFIPCFCIFLIKLKELKYLIAIAILAPVLAACIPIIIEIIDQALQQIHQVRAESSRVRGALERIALERWQNEAPIFGHGIVENGSHYVEYMAIGSHHTWLGLLFIKGIAGFITFAIALVSTLLWLTIHYFYSYNSNNKAQFIACRTSLHLILVLCAYTFTENLEILAYLHWPIFLFLGLTINRTVNN